MAKKTLSFAEKAARGKERDDSTYVKYVKSVKSKKTGHYRFNEQIVRIAEGESIDDALKRMDEFSHLMDIDMSIFDSDSAEAAKGQSDDEQTAPVSVSDSEQPSGNGGEQTPASAEESSKGEKASESAGDQTPTEGTAEPTTESEDPDSKNEDEESSSSEVDEKAKD